MAEKFFYCEFWTPNLNLQEWVWSVAKARKAHEAKKFYNVLFDDPIKPPYRVEFQPGFVGLVSIDDLGREIITHRFRETSPGVLFMSMMTHMTYLGQTHTKVRGYAFTFQEDGNLSINDDILYPRNQRGGWMKLSTADVSGHYLPYPKFGDYQYIVDFARNWPMGPNPDPH